jgi:hypothetical protein
MDRSRYVAVVNTTDLLILATVTGPIVASLVAPTVAKGLWALVTVRARRVKRVPVDGDDLYSNGVPMDEAQFRAIFAACQTELDELGPVADRNEWQLKQGFAAANRLAVLTGTHPHAFPNLGDPDDAWDWYKENNPYAIAHLSSRHGWRLLPPGDVATD